MSVRFNSFLVAENFLENLSQEQRKQVLEDDWVDENVVFDLAYEENLNPEEEEKMRQVVDQALTELQTKSEKKAISDPNLNYLYGYILENVAQVVGRSNIYDSDSIRFDFEQKTPLAKLMFEENDNHVLNLSEAKDWEFPILTYLTKETIQKALKLDYSDKLEDLIGEKYFDFWNTLEELFRAKEALEEQNIGLREFIAYFIKNPEHVAQIMELKSAFKFLKQQGYGSFVAETQDYLKDDHNSFYGYLYQIWMMEALYRGQNLLVFAH